MKYPEDLSPQARARVEAERLKAGEQLEQRRDQVPWVRYGPVRADEENLRKYILRVFLVFAQEACKLGSQRQWTVDRIRSEVDEFLRRFTIEAYSDKGHDKSGRKLREMTDNYGSILPKVQWEFKKSAEYHQFERELLAVAEQQARVAETEQTQAEVAAQPGAMSKKEQKRGRTRDDTITDRNNEIAALAASEKTPLEIAKHLDARQKYSVPDSWTVEETGGDGYVVGSFEKAYRIPHLRKKLNDLIYEAKNPRAR